MSMYMYMYMYVKQYIYIYLCDDDDDDDDDDGLHTHPHRILYVYIMKETRTIGGFTPFRGSLSEGCPDRRPSKIRRKAPCLGLDAGMLLLVNICPHANHGAGIFTI